MGKAILIADLGYGDAGKGSITDWLAHAIGAHTVVRYNGGAQAAHTVVLPDGRHHTFSQFGAGTMRGAGTHLSRYMVVDPPAMLAEAEHLHSLGVERPFAGVTLDKMALVVTPYHRAINRLRELARGNERHGSCGMGIGEAVSDKLAYGVDNVLLVGDLTDPKIIYRKLEFIRSKKLDVAKHLGPCSAAFLQEFELLVSPPHEHFDDFCSLADSVRLVDESFMSELLKRPGNVIFEGAQGVLLDETYGFHPYTTWSNTTYQNALHLLQENNYKGEILKLGLTRAYTTRHGPGPFVTENRLLTEKLQDVHNGTNPWQREFRVGWFDAVATRYAIKVLGGIDYLVVSHLDRLCKFEWNICDSYIMGYSGLFHDIEFDRLPTMDRQENLCKLLMGELGPCIPQLKRLETLNSYPDVLSARLGVPIGIESWGPTADEKQGRI